MVFLKEFFKKDDFEKNQHTTMVFIITFRPDLDPNYLTLMIFLKKLILKKNQQMTKTFFLTLFLQSMMVFIMTQTSGGI